MISKKATDWYADVVPYKPETESAGALKGTVAKPGCALGKKATTTVLAACEKKGASACFINVTQIAADMKTNFPEMKDSTYVEAMRADRARRGDFVSAEARGRGEKGEGCPRGRVAVLGVFGVEEGGVRHGKLDVSIINDPGRRPHMSAPSRNVRALAKPTPPERTHDFPTPARRPLNPS